MKLHGEKNWEDILKTKYKGFPNINKMQARVRFLDELKGFVLWIEKEGEKWK